MSEPSLSEIAKVPAGSAGKTAGRSRSDMSRGAQATVHKGRRHWEIWLLRHQKIRRNTVSTFFERRTGTDNRGTLEHTVDLIRLGLPVTRQEAPGLRKFGR